MNTLHQTITEILSNNHGNRLTAELIAGIAARINNAAQREFSAAQAQADIDLAAEREAEYHSEGE